MVSRSHIHRLTCAGALALAICLVVACLCGCTDTGGKQDQKPQGRTFTDSVNRTMEVPDTIERVAVTNGAAQEMVVTLAPGKLVCLAEDITQQQAAYLDKDLRKLPVLGLLVGDDSVYSKASLEKANPQIIIDVSPKSETIAAEMDALQERTGIPCAHIDASLDSLGQAYSTLGWLLAADERAKELSDYCDSSIASVHNALGQVNEDKPRIAYLLGSAGTNAMAQTNPQAAVVDMVANNIMRIDPSPLSDSGTPTSAEQVALWDPDIIVFGSTKAYESLPSTEPWNEISAIKKGTYYCVPRQPYNWLSSPIGVNQLIGLQWLTCVCYPDDAPLNLKKQVAEHYEVLYNHKLTDEEYEQLTENALPKETTKSKK